MAGTIDFGPISSIAYARDHRRLVLSRRLSISSYGAVDSIQLIARRPLDEVESIALTPKSATSVALLKTILRLRYERDVVFGELLQPLEAALRDVDGVLLIGDEALDAHVFPLEGTVRYDLGDLWREWTGLPMVYAVWAARDEFLARRGSELASVEDELVASMDYGRGHSAEVIEGAKSLSRFDTVSLDRYFHLLYYGFAPEYEAGLRRFYELAYEAGEIAEPPRLRFLDEAAGADDEAPLAGAEGSRS